MGVDFSNRGILHKLSNRSGFKVNKHLLRAESTTLFTKDLITNKLRGKEYHFNFTRSVDTNGKHHTKVSLTRNDTPTYKSPGILHRIDRLSRRFEGDYPHISITKSIDSFSPSTKKGKTAKLFLSKTNRLRKISTSIAWKSALSAETATITTGKIIHNKLKNNMRDNFDSNDTGKVAVRAISSLSAVSRARKVIIQNRLKKNQLTLYKGQYKLSKLKYSNLRKKYKNNKKLQGAELNKYDKALVKTAKSKAKNYKKLKRYHLTKPLVLTGAVAATTASVKHLGRNIVSQAQDNDFVQGLTKTADIAHQARIVKSAVKNHKVNKAVKRTEKLNSRTNKLQQKRNKLTKKQQIKKKNNHKPATKPKPVDKVQQVVTKMFSFIFKFFGFIAAPLLLIIFLFAIVLMIFGGVSSKNTAILGTYYCSDYDMAQAIEAYTDIAYTFNENVMKCKSSSNWKSGLSNFGIDTSDMDDTPTSYVFGRNNFQNYDPKYDFDANKLIAFICAYTYDFTDGDDKQQTWSYSEAEIDEVLQTLFDKEYKFEAKYVNDSYWQQSNVYTVYPGNASDELYLCKGSGSSTVNGNTYGYIDFDSCGVPSALTSFAKDETVYFDISTGEIKNANKSYKKTGFYFQNLNKTVTDPSGGNIPAFYSKIVNDNETFWGWRGQGNDYNHKTQLTVNGNNFDWAMAQEDVKTAFNENDKQAVRFYKKEEYITECTLYSNVKQLKTFDNAIAAVLEEVSSDDNDYAQRIQYYQILSCQADDNGKVTETYGLHQIFDCAPLPGNYDDLKIFNGFGYDIQKWGSKHCNDITMHYGNDYEATTGSNVYSLISGKVETIDSANHLIEIKTTEDMEFWYEDSNKRTVKITYSNVTAKSGLQQGDIVTMGDSIGKVDNHRHCEYTNNSSAEKDYLHISVQVKYGLFWHDVDPQFLISREN